MSFYIPDTDIAGFVQSRHATVLQHIGALPVDAMAVTTIITFGEDLSGWLPACRRAPDGVARAQAYSRLQRGLDFYRQMACLPFDDDAVVVFDQLRAQKPGVGTNDLSIAAITLSAGGVLVTRNAVDFQKIPGLLLEDWTK